jgi:uncharacterized protein (TIGR04255 family)
MTLPQPERVLFGRTPLKQVIAQVRYPVLPRFGEPGFVAPFIESLRGDFPRVSREVQRNIMFSSSDAGVRIGADETLWRLGSTEGNCAAVVGEGAITLEISQHQSVEHLLRHFQVLLDALVTKLDISSRERLGLRYINEFRHPGATLAHWSRLLSPELLGVAGTDLFDGDVDRMTQEIRVRREDGILAIRHGLVDGALITQPEKAGDESLERTYLLDLDYYDPRQKPLDIGDTVAQLKRYGDFMYRVFRWTLGPELYKLLEPKDGE